MINKQIQGSYCPNCLSREFYGWNNKTFVASSCTRCSYLIRIFQFGLEDKIIGEYFNQKI
jgi:hypothetical protein